HPRGCGAVPQTGMNPVVECRVPYLLCARGSERVRVRSARRIQIDKGVAARRGAIPEGRMILVRSPSDDKRLPHDLRAGAAACNRVIYLVVGGIQAPRAPLSVCCRSREE